MYEVARFWECGSLFTLSTAEGLPLCRQRRPCDTAGNRSRKKSGVEPPHSKTEIADLKVGHYKGVNTGYGLTQGGASGRRSPALGPAEYLDSRAEDCRVIFLGSRARRHRPNFTAGVYSTLEVPSLRFV